MELLKGNYRTGVRLGLISEKNYAPLTDSLGRLSRGELSDAEVDVARARFYAAELAEAIRVFGAFNADTDANLFFRPGLVDFKRFAEQLGRVAGFYSNLYSKLSAQPFEDNLWKEFFDHCADKSAGLTWSELTTAHRECSNRFTRILEAHFNNTPMRGIPNFADRDLGLTIKSYPTTSVLVGRGYSEAKAAMKRYDEECSAKFGFNFFLSDSEDVKFGYWGGEQDLAAIEARLPKDRDEKKPPLLAARNGELARGFGSFSR
ncbi:MAG: hypothetical protein HC883_05915 [Bdellovibrionaceae bacterium]|nr:hypothetical protein [Pseudobdellovibrionaceae bacterium]